MRGPVGLAPQETIYSGERALFVAIIASAVRDVNQSMPPNRIADPDRRRFLIVSSRGRMPSYDRWQSYESALVFLFGSGGLFELLCDYLEIDAGAVRERMKSRMEKALGGEAAFSELRDALLAPPRRRRE